MKQPPTHLQSIKRSAISVFLLFHIAAITCWCVPLDSPLIAAFRNVIRPYLRWSGLFQSWDMFAPLPKTINGYVEAAVIHKDGRIQRWTFPRMEQLSISERYREERYRKFVENLREDRNTALWPDAARYIARLNNDVSNPPEIVMLLRHWSDIVPHFDIAPPNAPWHVQVFYEYRVRPIDLQ